MTDIRPPIQHLAQPASLSERLKRLRFTLARRVVQLALLALFIGTAHFGWRLFGKPLLAGDLSASLIAGTIPLADPFATLEHLCAGQWPDVSLILGALFILVFYWLAGGRSFCAWVCPMNMVTDAADWLRVKFGIKTDWLRMNHRVRYGVAAGSLIASAATGTAAFEWLSPQALLWREAVWGMSLAGAAVVFGIFALDLLMVRRGWCGHLCPLGAFWSVVGFASPLKVTFDDAKCSRCGDCAVVCPEPQVINLKKMAERGFVTSGECTLCGRCLTVCPEDALHFGLRPRHPAIPIHPKTNTNVSKAVGDLK